ncbi:pentatricopeptide repeat-containing protein At4g39530 [Amborella trichopoda]|uniref:pentatricopeptide repeat-containing protein At4g39530 n=1 Tax=Amborella trichopoda TaxID=13333 RepID=UPI0005D3A36A|nr:pentatricopeptide repeat-containing protein At4g39530 [Amborella trichopoda]|eukprot:XP_011629091.1 pentatricopeptide repeat-containing protein At4g39530 [Amborella trichopoda]
MPQIYCYLIKSSFPLNKYQSSSLVNIFAKYGNLQLAHELLLNSPDTDTVSWNSLISVYADIKDTHFSFGLFDSLQRTGLRPDVYTLSTLLKASCELGEIEQTHGAIIKLGFVQNGFTGSGLIDNYSKAGELGLAEKCFEEFLAFDSVVWATMIAGYVRNGHSTNAVKLFEEMHSLGMVVTQFSLTSVLSTIVEMDENIKGQQIHCLGIKLGLLYGFSSVCNSLLSMYCRCGFKTEAVDVFEEMEQPDIVSWTALLGAYDGEQCIKVFKNLCRSKMEMNEYTMINALSAIGSSKLLLEGKQLHSLCLKAGFGSFVCVANALVSMYSGCMRIDDSRKAFDETDERDVISWNAMLAGYAENGYSDLAFTTFSWMNWVSVKPTKATFFSLLEGIAGLHEAVKTVQIHTHMIKLGFLLDNSIATCLITVYGKCSLVEKSRQVFYEIAMKETTSMNALVAAFVQASCFADALKLFQEMRNSLIAINQTTYSIVVKASTALTALDQGKQIHSLVLKSGFENDKFVGSSIIDMYCKCGSINDAAKAFEKLAKSNVASWNAMITGYAQHGCYNEALWLFERMSGEGMDPDQITFLGVLYACCHRGQVAMANYYLNSMLECCNVVPCLEHYACVIDLLGRHGKLNAVKDCIEHMPLKPDARIWQMFLSACTIHGNLELGKVAARELILSQPENDAAYVLLSNLYASAGMWDDVRKMRKLMREKAVRKDPSYSWIQVKGTVHLFYVADSSHPQVREIYAKLEELNGHMSFKDET